MGRRRRRRRSPLKIKFKKDTLFSIALVLLFAVGALTILSFSRSTALFVLTHRILNEYFGWTAIFLPFLFFSGGLLLTRLKWKIAKPTVMVGGLLAAVSLAGLTKAGALGSEIWINMAALITGWGAGIVLSGLAVVGLVILTETPLDTALLKAVEILSAIRRRHERIKSAGWKPVSWERSGKADKVSESAKPVKKIEVNDEEKLKSPAPPENQVITGVPGAAAKLWKYPPITLFQDSIGGKADRGDVKKNADIIEQTLDSFGIRARVVEVNEGPAVTQYCLEIALGTKLAKITTLQNDLALALAAPTGQIRVEAPIPGRSLVGVEVPNRSPEFVCIKSMLAHKALKNHPSKLAVGLGLNVSGKPVVADIDEMPHILIAGATGSGKSVAINSFLCSILFRASPSEVQLILVDPKRVELTAYNGIPHLLTPVIVDPSQVVSALKWVLREMESRYKKFAEVGVRNIAGYNEKSGFQAMPYLLVVVDELADIMLFSPAEVEECITRLAQMARATGIHLVVSTQRPSTDVITGLIKANIPCRIAFNVTSMVDSRVILDMPGAEKLLGRGDMLYVPPSQAKPTRIQGTYVSDREIEAIIAYLSQQGINPQYNEAVTEKYRPGAAATSAIMDSRGGEADDLFEEAARLVARHNRASASLLQRRLSIGYARAARILDQLQYHGIVGPPEASKPREVLIKDVEEVLARLKMSERAEE